MSDRIDELERNVEPQAEWLCQRLNVQGNGYDGGPDDRALLEVRMTVRQLATIAREAEARAAEWVDRCYQSEERALKAEAERAKHAALVEAAKAVDDYVSGHFSRDKVQYIDCPPCREKLLALRAAIADLEASDD